MTAEKILIKMKSGFADRAADGTPITLEGNKLGIVSSHVRPLFGIFKQAGITLSIPKETTPEWPSQPFNNEDAFKRKLYDMTYAQPILTISISENNSF